MTMPFVNKKAVVSHCTCEYWISKSFIILGRAVVNNVSFSKPKKPPSNIVIIITNFALSVTLIPPYFPFQLSQHKGGHFMKTDLQTARRNLNSPNIKTRKRALKIIKQHKKIK